MKTQAVFTGINNYINYPKDRLRGCLNDMNNLRLWFVHKLNQNPGDYTLLKDSKAKAATEKAAILEAGRRAGPGGRLIWSHSSHGSNNPDPSQADGLQELLLCYDTREKSGRWDEDTCITAKWIGEMCRELSFLSSIDIILDCCHAPEGSQLKDLALSYNRARFMRRTDTSIPVRPRIIQAIQSPIPDNVALWSACEPAQYSQDAYIEKTWQGAFTYAFLRFYTPRRTRSDIIYHARNWLRAEGYGQTPHLYCWRELAFRGIGE